MRKPFVMDGRKPFVGALDFSHLLDAPAGKHGFLRNRDGELVFEDGTQIRFFGVNCTGEGAMPDKDAARATAERLATAGVNMVRLHNPDGRRPNGRSLVDYSGGDSQRLSEDGFDHLDYFISELKKRGIYIHIDLFVSRAFLPGDDLDYPDDVNYGALKQLFIFNGRLKELHKKFIAGYLTHVNPYTGLAYKDDPAVAVVQVMNENSIYSIPNSPGATEDDRYATLPNYYKELDQRFNAWLIGKYSTREKLAVAWTDEEGRCALMADEDPAKGTVKRPDILFFSAQPVWDDKAPYDSFGSPARYGDHTEFLLGIQLDFSREMSDYLRALGVKCCVNISNHSQGAADTRGITTFEDVSEDNGYWNHPMKGHAVPSQFHGDIMSACDPRETEVGAFRLNLLTRLSVDRVAGKPFMIGEWDSLYPPPYSSDAMLMLPAYAMLNGWDGLNLYSYTHHATLESLGLQQIRGYWNVFNDPSNFGLFGSMAAIFQKGWIAKAKKTVDVCYTQEDSFKLTNKWRAPYGFLPYVSNTRTVLMDRRYDGDADAAISSGMTPTGDYRDANRALVFARQPYADKYHRQNTMEAFRALHSMLPNTQAADGSSIDDDWKTYSRVVDAFMKKEGVWEEDKGLVGDEAIVSDTGELCFRFSDGYFALNAPYAAGYAGIVRGEIDMGGIGLSLKNERMTLVMIALDDKPLAQSRHRLLTAVGECANTNMQWDGLTLLTEGEPPIWIDALQGTLRTGDAAVYPLDPQGNRAERLAPVDGKVVLPEDTATIYFEIVG